MPQKLNLNKLKEEIHNRKTKQVHLGDNSSVGAQPKDGFLNGLVESLRTGTPSEASETIKTIDNIAEHKQIARKGGTPTANIHTTTTSPPPPTNTNQGLADAIASSQGGGHGAPPPNYSNNDVDRDKLLWEEFERKKNEVLHGGAINTYNNAPQHQQQSNGGMINEGMVNEIINNKFATLVEQAMRDTIVEIYATSRMRETIDENRDLIREIVIDVIRELQKKKKPQS